MQFEARIASVSALADRKPQLSPTDLAARAMRCLDLTSLSNDDTDDSVAALCARAAAANTAAVCVYPRFVRTARAALKNTQVRCASVAMDFPSAHAPLDARLQEVAKVREDGADEIDIVIRRELVHEDHWDALADELRQARRIAADRTLKVILETCELPSHTHIYRAARTALDQGADFIKTSTGKGSAGAQPDAVAAMLLAIEDGGHASGLKVSGGIRTLDDYRVFDQMVSALWGPHHIHPQRFRIGASSLLASLRNVLASKATG